MKKPQYTKVVVSITTILFVMTLISCLTYMFFITFSGQGETVDYVVATTSLTVMGGIYSIVLKCYMSKSGLENVASIRKSCYKEIMETRLVYDERVLQLQQKYDVSQSDINDIEDNAPFKDLSNSTTEQLFDKLDEVDVINSSEPNED